jgi:hypothetical protein
MIGAQCFELGCVNIVKQRGRYCNTCRSRRCRKRNPYRYAYQTTKDNAKRRKILFDLTYKYFKKWCVENKYIEYKGRGGDDMSIDRDNPLLGYVEGNLKMITKRDNSIKQHTDKYSLLHQADQKWVEYAEELKRRPSIAEAAPVDPPF